MSTPGKTPRGRLAFLATLVAIGMLTAIVAPSAQAAPPDNDAIENAVDVPGVPFTDTRDTGEASFTEGDSGCGAATVWYVFTPATSGEYAIDTLGSDYDTTLALHVGSPGNLELLACNDDVSGVQSAIQYPLSAGTTYYVEAGTCCGAEPGQIGPGGTLVLNANSYTPFQIEVTIDGRGRVGAEPGTAIVSGTVTCNAEGTVGVSGTLRQRHGQMVIRGDFSTVTGCSTTPTMWTAIADAGSRLFSARSASVSANAGGCDLFTCDDDSASRTIRLRRR